MFKLLPCLIFVLVESESAKILGVFPFPSISHQVVFRPLMHELARRGHEVTVITPDPAFPKGQAPKNLTEIDVHDIAYDQFRKFVYKNVGKEIVQNQLKTTELLIEEFYDILETQLKSDQVKKLLEEKKEFDLVFFESCVRPALIFSHIYNAPAIEFSSASGMFATYGRVGAASHPLVYPDVFHRRIYNLTIWEKLTEVYNHYSLERIFAQKLPSENEKLKSLLGPNTPNLEDLSQNVQMLFLNVHSIWDLNRPVPPNVVYLGGLHQKPQRVLPKDLQTYLDSSKHGVIYMSLGTNIKPEMLPLDKIKVITDVFSQLPFDVLWKWDNDVLPGRSENIKISKWLPQSDLLRHPKIKLFITQAGMQSTDEAIIAGVPLIGVPIVGDQPYNAEQYIKFNIGKKLEISTLTEGQLFDVINDVINDESYRQNMIKLRNIIYDQPQSSLERAVWWTEYVLRNGGAHLRAPAAHMSWTEYYELELVLILLSSVVLLLLVTILAFYFVINSIKSKQRKVKVN